MKSEEKLKITINAMLCRLANLSKRKGDEVSQETIAWTKGAMWMALYATDGLEGINIDDKRLDSLIKSRALFSEDFIQSLLEGVSVSHIDADFNDLFVKTGPAEQAEGQTCTTCNFMKKERPDGLKLKNGHLWCKKTSREVMRTYWCKMGKWGFSS
ncbi:MAG: hypothetical protein CVV64_05355 [Candidatus Wallbacteria bacterium HGW-Wallbacteria-1]|jgi:hypothetical protein|uniref:Uncharacterized protein n=1 Tax=Candidatus Wallbacteria bacterium HGW-Wallbacteria-1 TaxID=2013854 RepID=A0A2N1PS83_9BACT|nr:MAG: hypothetical protein CVV64_05355 [Candidatus Wallbacteria bacterium HGW-Wallbacteria-1]